MKQHTRQLTLVILLVTLAVSAGCSKLASLTAPTQPTPRRSDQPVEVRQAHADIANERIAELGSGFQFLDWTQNEELLHFKWGQFENGQIQGIWVQQFRWDGTDFVFEGQQLIPKFEGFHGAYTVSETMVPESYEYSMWTQFDDVAIIEYTIVTNPGLAYVSYRFNLIDNTWVFSNAYCLAYCDNYEPAN